MNRIPTLRFLAFAALLVVGEAPAREIHVAVTGSDAAAGSATSPLRTISAAAQQAMPDDTVTVHEGIYREQVVPPRGGESDAKRITYQAAKGEKVVITGTEVVKTWQKVSNDTWMASFPTSFFGTFNPYAETIHGDWLAQGQWNHLGAVYLNGVWLLETPKKEEVLAPAGNQPRWFTESDKDQTVIYAQFKGVDPNRETVEINVRKSVFTPEKTGVNYITVRGFTLKQAATPWAPPTAGQIGLVGPNWSRGWIIESNLISQSKCAGISIGKYGDEWDNKCESVEGYMGTIERALANGWNKETVGGHIIRNNDISFCEQNGVVGSLGCAFSVITGNSIHDIHTQNTFWGYEIAGIKLHGAVDVEISHNHIYRTEGGIWLDWMLQGSRVSGNLLHDNRVQDLSFEVDHGPVLVDNNLFLSPEQAQLRLSQGCAFVHNLNAWRLWKTAEKDERQTPFMKPHSTAMGGRHDNPTGDTRYYNNLFTRQTDLRDYDKATLPVWMEGNVFLKGTVPSAREKAPLLKLELDPELKVSERADGWYLTFQTDSQWAAEQKRRLVTTERLGKAVIPSQEFTNPDGSPITIDTDYFGKPRDKTNPFPGPFEAPVNGELKVWPK